MSNFATDLCTKTGGDAGRPGGTAGRLRLTVDGLRLSPLWSQFLELAQATP